MSVRKTMSAEADRQASVHTGCAVAAMAGSGAFAPGLRAATRLAPSEA